MSALGVLIPIRKRLVMYTIGIDLGGTNIAVGLCDESLNIVEKMSVRTGGERPADEIVKDMADVSRELIEKHSLSLDDIEYVGIAIPGAVVPECGKIEFTSNLPFVEYPITEKFKELLPVAKVLINNDANAAALGEALAGAARGTRSSIMITLGTGVGGGVIIDGKIFAGGLNSSGTELGHTVIVKGGRPCGCGRRGCWETYASATGLTRSTMERLEELSEKGISSLMFSSPKISARTAFDAARKGDVEGQRVVDEFIEYLALGVTDMVNIFQPEIVIIGGGISAEGDFLINPLTAIVDSEQYTKRNAVRTKIVAAVLGNDAGIIGAAGLGKV